MTIQDTFHYILFGNPVSQQIVSAGCGLAKKVGLLDSSPQKSAVVSSASPVSSRSSIASSSAKNLSLWKLSGFNHNLIRLAGLSGAAAVLLGAYGSHRTYNDEKGESKLIFETANRFHFFHTIALLALPLSHRPYISGSLMIVGTVLFTGPCYRKAFTGDNSYARLAPMGGGILILAWLSLII